MVGGEAVIGLPGSSSVKKYDMTAQSTAGVTEMSSQTLSGTSIATVDGVTTMKYTKIMDESGEQTLNDDSSTILVRTSVANQRLFGAQPNRGRGADLASQRCARKGAALVFAVSAS